MGVLVDIVATLNDYEEPRYRLKVIDTDDLGKELTLWGAEGLDTSAVKRGQIIGYKLDTAEEVSEVKLKYDPLTGTRGSFTNIGESIGQNPRYAFGKVGMFEEGKYMTVIPEEATALPTGDDPYEIQTVSVYISQGRLYKYDESLPGYITTATAADILDYEAAGDNCSRVLITTGTFWPRGMIIFNDVK